MPSHSLAGGSYRLVGAAKTFVCSVVNTSSLHHRPSETQNVPLLLLVQPSTLYPTGSYTMEVDPEFEFEPISPNAAMSAHNRRRSGTTSADTNDDDGGRSGFSTAVWSLIIVVAVCAALFALLYTRYRDAHHLQHQQDVHQAVRRGQVSLLEKYRTDDGVEDESMYAVDWSGVVADRRRALEKRAMLEIEAREREARGGKDGEEGGEGEGGSPKGIWQKITGMLRSGRLFRIANKFSVRTKAIGERVAQKQQELHPESPEAVRERERFSRFTDEAIDPLYPLRLRQFREQNNSPPSSTSPTTTATTATNDAQKDREEQNKTTASRLLSTTAAPSAADAERRRAQTDALSAAVARVQAARKKAQETNESSVAAVAAPSLL